MSPDPKAYLGDGIYVTNDGWHIVLTTENGIAATNTVFLEPEVWERLRKYVAHGLPSWGVPAPQEPQ